MYTNNVIMINENKRKEAMNLRESKRTQEELKMGIKEKGMDGND